ncbi:MAG TPA: tetratricopeptide repeat protein [Brevefilum fermentans]|jgi:soluble lytic murein transglycosylase|nr:tetratricopeptide repeat protein [Brevefilum fermentans]
MNNVFKIILGALLLSILVACSSPMAQSPAKNTLPPFPTVVEPQTPQPSPTATRLPPPELLVGEGDYALLAGDFQSAIRIFQEALNNSKDDEVTALAHFGLGRAYFNQGEISIALTHFRQAAQTGETTTAARAQFMLGQIYTRLERYQEALDAYQSYLDVRPGLIDAHVHELRGDLFTTLGNYSAAIECYQQAFLSDPSGGTDTQAIKIARAYQANGETEIALSLYKDLYSGDSNDYTKAQMALLIGRIFLSQNNDDQAYAIFQESIHNFPFAYDAYSALVTLVEADITVNEFDRGLVNHNMGNHLLAVEAFDRYLAEAPEFLADAALYYKGLSMRALGEGENQQAAIALWQELIENHPTSSYYIDAWQSIEYTLWAYLGDHQAAAQASLDFVAQRPEAAEAPDFLFRAGRSYERADMLSEAVETWARVAAEYPESDLTFQATYFAGISLVRLGLWEEAQALFSRAMVLTGEPSELAAAHLWIGKCQQAQGNISAALDSWKIAQTTNPFGHYSIRAEDLLIGREPFSTPTRYELDPDLTPFLPEAESWLRETFGIAPEINLESPGMLAYDPRFQRGLEYWSLGDYAAGKAEFDAIRLEYTEDPAQTFRLIPALVEIGLYRSALVASTQLLRLAGLQRGDALQAPEYFSRVRFGAYFLEWVQSAAQSEGLSPLLLLSVIRQESAFEGFILSGAGARGLMQIMPATGAQLAANLSWPEDYTVDDLDRPNISIFFGANYLRQQYQLFDEDPFAMLAAYNGGPGNTIIWKNLTPFDDPDLFLEIVRIEETRNYIRLINEIHYIYGWLYGEPEER